MFPGILVIPTICKGNGINTKLKFTSLLLFVLYLCPAFNPMTAAKRAKKNPANPVAPVSNTNSPIKTGINVKNFNL